MQLNHILVFKILDMWSDKIPVLLICNILLIKLKTVSVVLKKLSKAMLLHKYLLSIDYLGGDKVIVEVDELK